MRHLNYNHLFYFWTVANEGSIARASEVLHITPQTISGQLRLLEDNVGEPLFHRVGRGLVLSDAGLMVKHYADEIFQLGATLAEHIRGHRFGVPNKLTVGVVDSVAKLIATRMLESLLDNSEPIRVTCVEGALPRLLGELAVHRLDVVISDQPMPKELSVKVLAQRIGSSEIGFFAPRKLVKRYGSNFPAFLSDAPLLMPTGNSVLRRGLDDWFEAHNIAPNVIAEFEDSALMKAFGERGAGIFPAANVIRDEVCQMYQAQYVGTASGVTETYYAMMASRRRKHPLLQQLIEAARHSLFPVAAVG